MHVFRSISFLCAALFAASAFADHTITIGRSPGMPELHWAAYSGDVEEVRRLIAAGASVHEYDSLFYQGWRQSALYWGVRGGSPGVVRALVAAGAAVNPERSHQLPLIVEAVRYGAPHFRALLALLSSGADTGHWGARALQSAVTLHVHGTMDDGVCFGREGVDYGDGGPPCFLAAGGGQVDARQAIWFLRRFGVDPNHGRAKQIAVGASWERFLWSDLASDVDGAWSRGVSPVDQDSPAADWNSSEHGDTPLLAFLDIQGGWNSARDPRVLNWLLSAGGVELPDRIYSEGPRGTYEGSPVEVVQSLAAPLNPTDDRLSTSERESFKELLEVLRRHLPPPPNPNQYPRP